jgi:hypothetical protein
MRVSYASLQEVDGDWSRNRVLLKFAPCALGQAMLHF